MEPAHGGPLPQRPCDSMAFTRRSKMEHFQPAKVGHANSLFTGQRKMAFLLMHLPVFCNVPSEFSRQPKVTFLLRP